MLSAYIAMYTLVIAPHTGSFKNAWVARLSDSIAAVNYIQPGFTESYCGIVANCINVLSWVIPTMTTPSSGFSPGSYLKSFKGSSKSLSNSSGSSCSWIQISAIAWIWASSHLSLRVDTTATCCHSGKPDAQSIISSSTYIIKHFTTVRLG